MLVKIKTFGYQPNIRAQSKRMKAQTFFPGVLVFLSLFGRSPPLECCWWWSRSLGLPMIGLHEMSGLDTSFCEEGRSLEYVKVSFGTRCGGGGVSRKAPGLAGAVPLPPFTWGSLWLQWMRQYHVSSLSFEQYYLVEHTKNENFG